MFSSSFVESDICQQYCSAVRRDFGTEVQRRIDFSSPEAAANTINNYFVHQSHHTIDHVASAADITSETKLAVLNGVYIKALWAKAFEQIGPHMFMGLDRKGEG
ncbi:alaserpin isoform x2 [Cystoisospora suis]|uniref:Alaserpin isoform x2 n=1 Tax=Cystoisospora suis TaxID=483139 RepID=A0A2C6KR17_9APIC|nr:alaserpin isoform x2 [Cystoisospora suis]